MVGRPAFQKLRRNYLRRCCKKRQNKLYVNFLCGMGDEMFFGDFICDLRENNNLNKEKRSCSANKKSAWFRIWVKRKGFVKLFRRDLSGKDKPFLHFRRKRRGKRRSHSGNDPRRSSSWRGCAYAQNICRTGFGKMLSERFETLV